MSRLDLVFAIVAAMLLLMILLQAVLNRKVWNGYLIGLPVVLVVWVLASPWPQAVLR